ncbi:hypothetical protein [Paenibacillus amylolyticus]
MMMPISRRLALLDWAERAGTYLIEDDYDGEFRYSGRPIPSSMQGLRENAPVIYMGGILSGACACLLRALHGNTQGTLALFCRGIQKRSV